MKKFFVTILICFVLIVFTTLVMGAAMPEENKNSDEDGSYPVPVSFE